MSIKNGLKMVCVAAVMVLCSSTASAWWTRSACMESFQASQPLASLQSYKPYQINYSNGYSSLGLRWYYFQTTNSGSALAFNDSGALKATKLGCTLIRRMYECGCTVGVDLSNFTETRVIYGTNWIFYRKFAGLCSASLGPAWLQGVVYSPANGFDNYNDH